MNADNPYAPPAIPDTETPGRNAFVDIDTRRLKKLRNDSHTIRAAVLVMLLAVVFIAPLLSAIASTSDSPGQLLNPAPVLFLVMLLGPGAAMVGLACRSRWGRIAGLAASILMLVVFPIGTLIAILLLISLVRSPQLFGPDRFKHRDLEAEWKYRKRSKVP